MKHRAKSSKIEYQHKMIHGLRIFLKEELEPLEYVTAIFPREIKRAKSASLRLKVRFKYPTKTGVKLLAYGSGVVQEVFIVTSDVEALKEKISQYQSSLLYKYWTKPQKNEILFFLILNWRKEEAFELMIFSQWHEPELERMHWFQGKE